MAGRIREVEMEPTTSLTIVTFLAIIAIVLCGSRLLVRK
jgi:hypothetical protein